MEELFKAKNEAINQMLRSTCDTFIFANKGKSECAIGIMGNTPDLLMLLHETCKAVRSQIELKLGKRIADELIGTVILTDDEVREETKRLEDEMYEMKAKIEDAPAEIPAWLKRLMKLEEKDAEKEDDDERLHADLDSLFGVDVSDSDDSGE